MKAYELLDSPEKWCQGPLAVDAEGKPEDFNSINACKWCMAGAIGKCYSNLTEEIRNLVLYRIGSYSSMFFVSVGHWNNNPKRTWEEVYSILKELDI